MEGTILGLDLKSIAIADVFDSFIWTDRYCGAGDFELYVPIDASIVKYLVEDYYVTIDESDRVMTIDEIKVTSDPENGNHLIATGESLEKAVLDRRIVWVKTILTGSLQNGVKKLLEENAIYPALAERKISRLIFEASTDPAITSLTAEGQYFGETLYEAITTLCDAYSIGFKITLTEDLMFKFKLYAGANRSYSQFANPYVVFSPKNENIANSNFIRSKKDLRTVTLVAGEELDGVRKTATASYSGGSGTELNRREKFTDAGSVSSAQSQKNLFDKTKVASGFLDLATGAVTTNPDYPNSKYGDLIPIIGGTTYYISGYAGDMRYRMYNPDGSYYGNASFVAPAAWYTPVSGFVRPLFYTGVTESQLNGIQIEVGTEATSYAAFGESGELTPAQYTAQLVQKGIESLRESTYVKAVETQIEATNMFVYGRDFFMGDIVQVEDEYGNESKSRITEFIRSQDETGFSSYPTFMTIE